MEKFIKMLSKRLSESPLPGAESQDIMMVKPQKMKFYNNQNKIPAAVLILLYPYNEDWLFFLTKRTKIVKHHKGQISLPGGMVEKYESLTSAAIRETSEEIGIKKSNIMILGSLTPLYVPISNFEIFPYIGWILKEPKTKMHHKEVESIIKISINDLLLDKNLKIKKNMFPNLPASIPYFDLGHEKVWGATSMILSEFKSVLKDIL
ncbi:MAG: NUDIX hydrolase [Candidatus Neomarinimicrobiota bacterium]